MSFPKKKRTESIPVSKPYLSGSAIDANTAKNSLKFLGSILLVAIMSFFVCSVTGFDSLILRILINGVVIFAILYIFFHYGVNKGTENVAHGEILYQRKEKGLDINDQEKKLCFHKAKGFITGFLGVFPLFLIAVYFSFSVVKQTTDSGVLPSWMQAYTGRSEIGGALVNYLEPEGMTLVDAMRILIRICLMPFVSMFKSSNRENMYIIEKISPLLLILPSIAYGAGYLNGRKVRTMIHSSIAESNKKRIRKERIQKKKRRNTVIRNHEPEQLN